MSGIKINGGKYENENENILDKISRFSFVSAIIGVCIIGICPAFGVMGIVAPIVMKNREQGFRMKRNPEIKKLLLRV